MEECNERRNAICSETGGKELSSTTVLIYIKILTKLDKMKSVQEKDYDLAIKQILELPHLSLATKSLYLSALLWRTSDERFRDEIARLRPLIDKEYKDKLKPNETNWNAMQEKAMDHLNLWRNYSVVPVEKWTKHIYQKALFALLSYLYFSIPPRRSEYLTVKMIPGPWNFYNSSTRTFHFKQYKTSGGYGESLLTVNSRIDELIMQIHSYNKSDYLFTNGLGRPYSQSTFNALLRKAFGGATRLIRRSYISNEYEDVPAYNEMEERAAAMGHSVQTALRCYKKD